MASKGGVELPEGSSGSGFLHELLASAVDAFPTVLGDAGVPSDGRAFKAALGDVVARFEAARVTSPERTVIARHVRRVAAGRLRFVDARGSRPLAEVMAAPAEPLPVERIVTAGPGRLVPSVSADGARHVGDALRSWLARARAARALTGTAEATLLRLLERADADGGALSLAGERFALLGAGAELAPTELLLAAGADVLWIDLRPPPEALRASTTLGGVLHVPTEPADLLAAPDRIAATVRRFADGGPVHVGMYAYAGGESQEFRLTASMNAVVRALPRDAVRSAVLLISPTTPSEIDAEDASVAAARLAAAPAWQRALARAGVLRPGRVVRGDASVACTVVPVQGASYQAAQYVGKILAAETYALLGPALGDDLAPLTVSANVAPITRTRSLSHPVFEAAFLGAPAWGVTIAAPETTRSLNGLLAIADVTDPEAPASATRRYASPVERARAVFREQVHGGVFAQPYAMDGEIKVAAILGFAKRPGLLAKLLRG